MVASGRSVLESLLLLLLLLLFILLLLLLLLLLGQTKLICWGTDFSQNNLGRSIGKKMKIKKYVIYINSDPCHAMCQNTEISTACIFCK